MGHVPGGGGGGGAVEEVAEILQRVDVPRAAGGGGRQFGAEGHFHHEELWQHNHQQRPEADRQQQIKPDADAVAGEEAGAGEAVTAAIDQRHEREADDDQ